MSEAVQIIKRIQRIIGAEADGIIGKMTRAALAEYVGERWLPIYPSKSQIRSNHSIFGVAGQVPLVSIEPPYSLFYAGQRVETIRVHERVAHAVELALQRVLAHYGAQRIHELGLDVYDGSYNNRSVRGGTASSMHAWGIALDFNAARNGNRARGKDALFTSSEYDFWWLAWLSVGARPFGLYNNRDYMHLDFSRV